MSILPSKIGLRYSYARRGSNFIGLNAILAVIGITIGIAALIVVLSVMNGVVSDVRDKLLAMTAQVSLRPRFSETIAPEFDAAQYLRQDARIQAYAPYVEGQGLIGMGNSYQGILLHGLNPEEEGKVSETFTRIPEQARNALQAGSWNIILGKGLANQLGVFPGDKITIIVPKANASAAGLMPRLKRFTYVGAFESGHYQYDHQYVMVHEADAATLLQLPAGASGYQIKIGDAMQAPEIRKHLQSILPPDVYASDWSLDQAVYFNAVQMEKNAMFIILCLIVMVAAFGLLSSMYMVVTEKRRDIAILRTMGMTRGQIAQIFISQGMIFGSIGTVLGVSLGIVIALNVPYLMDVLQKMTGYEIPPQLYFVEQLSAKIDPAVVISISAITLIMTLLFSVIPAIIAARTEPARALSQE
ncbi:lipoprotein-releasing ABC transporter permease subunit [Suttonella indologenes]|uniref:Lipoprotein-releasing system transmembrane protein lolE n=1 Tax=Suttonella indologenes TaxID=13276 RepID=A0A380MJL0_9GAMM|nr:lipoprotein-releasing ABC transporter permease subunit [Suttonella indologenes]SUO91316.1 Lipoprotein-releasing system transmembrane protein lolE [Suttonella indologenes]